MIFNLFLLSIFLGGVVALWVIINQKLAKLVAVPEEEIIRLFETESSKIHLFILNLKSFFKEDRYKVFLLRIAAKVLIKIRFITLLLDNSTSSLLRIIKIKMGEKNGNGHQSSISTSSEVAPAKHLHWDVLKVEKGKKE